MSGGGLLQDRPDFLLDHPIGQMSNRRIPTLWSSV